MFLSKEEVQKLTGAVQPAKQVAWLKAEGFQLRVAGDGSVVVLAEHVRAMMGAAPSTTATKKKVTPNFSALRENKHGTDKKAA